MAASGQDTDDRAYARIMRRLLPFLGVCYLVAYLDRVNVSFARLGMLDDLGLSEVAAGVFFIGYFLMGGYGVRLEQEVQHVG